MTVVALGVRRVRGWSDVLVASDPGLVRLAKALEIVAGIGVTIAVEYGFSQLAHPLWVSVPAGVHVGVKAVVGLSAQHHEVSLIAMLLGGIVGMVGNFAMYDVARREQAITIIGMPVPLLATLSISIELVPHRAIGLIGLALVTGFGTYLRRFAPRFGPRVVMYGMLLFMGYFFGFLAGKELPIGQVYWLAAILWLAVLVNLTLRLVVFDRVDAGAFARSRRSFAARSRGVIAAAAAALEDPGDGGSARSRAPRRLARRLVRLNEGAITIDAQLADRRLRLRAGQAQALHDALFELELHLENLGRAITALAQPEAGLDPRLRARVLGWLAGLADGDTSDAAAYERESVTEKTPGTVLGTDDIVFATAAIVVEVGLSLGPWQGRGLPPVEALGDVDSTTAYVSPVMLIAGSLAGSTPASNAAVAPNITGGLAARLHLDSAAVAAIRMTVAVGVAIAIANAVNERRFYWAVIAVFMIFMGTNTAGEQITKAAERVLGTCVGIVLGSLLAHAVGPSTWSIAVILSALAFGVYFMPVSSGLLVIGFTVMVSMLYVDLGEFSNGLLVDRLELTAIGAGVAALAALVIFPVRTRRVVNQAVLQYLDALLALVEGLSEAVRGASAGEPLLAASPSTVAARHLDDTLQRLLVSARPLTGNPFRHYEPEHNLQGFVLSAYFARTLAADAGVLTALGETERAQLATALVTEADLVRDLHHTLEHPGTGADAKTVATAGKSIVEASRSLSGHGVLRSDPRQRFLRALFNLDGSLVQLDRQLADSWRWSKPSVGFLAAAHIPQPIRSTPPKARKQL